MMKKILDIFSGGKIKEKKKEIIVVDNREKNSLVVSELMSLGCDVRFEQLAVGDYIVKGVVIERKTISDLKSSIVNKRIIGQLFELKQYDKFFLLVEGILDEDMYSGGIHENAFRGFLLSVALEYNVPLIFTHNSKDTARYIDVLARRTGKVDTSLRASKIFMDEEEQVLFILEGFPNVGRVKAKKLLEKFGSLERIFDGKVEELEEILGKRGEEFKRLIEKEVRK